MTQQLTKEMANEYLDNPFMCPYCGSEVINSGSYDGEKESREVNCETCEMVWNECFTLTGIANENFTIEFSKLEEPKKKLWLNVEEGYYLDNDCSYLEVFLLKDGAEGNALLLRSEFNTEDMTEEKFDAFMVKVEEYAKAWDAELSIGFKKEDYFDESSSKGASLE